MANVLVVDDDKGYGDLIRATLAAAGHDAQHVESGKAALKVLSGDVFVDVMLLDLVMPGEIDGLGVMKRYQEISPLTSVIVVTAHESIPTAKAAVEFGVLRYLEKPIPNMPDSLLELIDEATVHVSAFGIQLNTETRSAVYNGSGIELSPTWFDMLSVFVRWPQKRFSFVDLGKLVFSETMEPKQARNKFNAHMSNLRAAVKAVVGKEAIGYDPIQKEYYLLSTVLAGQ